MTVPGDWQDFAEVIGGASGALTGLLFVAVSVNASRIAEHQGLRASAAQTLVLFITPLMVAAALLAPGQPDWVFGAELIAIGLISSWSLLHIGRRKQALDDDERLLVEIFNRRTPNIVVMLLFVAAGTVLACGSDAGLYLLLPAALVAFVSGVVNAWFFLLPPPREPTPMPEAGSARETKTPREPKETSESR
jgi:modulator of FtsH protease